MDRRDRMESSHSSSISSINAMTSRLTSSVMSKRLSSVSAFSSAASVANSSTTTSNSSNGSASPRTPTARHRKAGVPRIEAPRLRRSFSRPRSERDLRLELFFHIPGFSELQRLRVHRSLSLISLQTMLQREFAVPFEDQHLYFHGDLLEGDEDLSFYEIQDQSVINVRIRKRYRRIGDVFTKIRVVRFTTEAASPAVAPGAAAPASAAPKTLHLPPEDYELVEVVAALPPLHIVFRRLGIVIAYITMLDRMQLKRTHRRVWRQHVSYADEPAPALDDASLSSAGNRRFSSQRGGPNALASPLTGSAQVSDTAATGLPAASPPAAAVSVHSSRESQHTLSSDTASFIMRKCSPERVSNLTSIAHAHGIHERLRIPPDARSATDVRHIRKWLCSIKYFASANIPDLAFHEIARNCVYERHQSGDFIFRQGDVGDYFYILISGCISLAAYGNGYFATMTPGMCFGEISLFEAKGVRTASANVNFGTPGAELAVLSGDVYRRAINPFKQALLHKTEKAVYSVPQLRSLPDNILTHIAYASKSLTAKTGKRLIRHGDDVNVLVLLVAGEVKISTPRPRQQRRLHESASSASARFKPLLRGESTERSYPIVSVIRAPAVFGQEGCLSNTPRPAPWDIDAIDTCSLICLRMDTISIFLASQHDIIRALVAEHTLRVEDFRRRFAQYTDMHEQQQQQSRHSSTASVHKQASYLRGLASSRRLLADAADALPIDGGGTDPRQPRHASRIEFPKVLMRDDDLAMAAALTSATSPTLHDIRSPRAPPTTTSSARKGASLRSYFFGSRVAPSTRAVSSEHERLQQLRESEQVHDSPQHHAPPLSPTVRAQTAPTCAEVQDRFLHQALPFGGMLTLREQIQFVSFEQQQRAWDREHARPAHQQHRRTGHKRAETADDADDRAHIEAKTQALLTGLRKLRAQDVEMAVTQPHAPLLSTQEPHAQFHFVPVAPVAKT